MGKIYKGDVGTEIILDTGEPLADATVHNIAYKNASSTGVFVGEVVETTKIRYITTSTDDLDVAGDWKFQPIVTLPSWSGRGETAVRAIYDDFG